MTLKKARLSVNYVPVQIGDFVQQFIKSVIEGMLDSLKGHGQMGNINLIIDNDIVEITVGDDTLQLNSFLSNFVKNTVIGMVSSLRGVESIEKLEINIS